MPHPARISKMTGIWGASSGPRPGTSATRRTGVATRVTVVADGEQLDLHFQEYWVKRRARDEVKAIRYQGVEAARPSPGVLEAIEAADVVVLCPSNPIASLRPILSVPGIGKTVAGRRDATVGISPIVGGAPLFGMADRLMPVAGYAVTALGAAECDRE